jgi:hypothetical protein
MLYNEQIVRANNWRRDIIRVLEKEAVYSVDYKPGTGLSPSFDHIVKEMSIKACRPSSLGFSKSDLEHYRPRYEQIRCAALEDIRALKLRTSRQVGGVGVSKKDTDAIKSLNRDLTISKIILVIIDAQIKSRIIVVPTLTIEPVETKKLETITA